jgi:hydroxymethylpyrimidine/phosphomethylpyrimidine kinase
MDMDLIILPEDNMDKKKYFRVLTIAGSDSGGGAGIQADLKTFSALGCYGMSVVTAITAQNTVNVRAIHKIPAKIVGDQIDAVIEDIGVDAVKVGMLQTPEVIKTVSKHLKKWKVENIIVDPVMVAKSGDKLLLDNAVDALKSKMLPLATVITPNIPEAEVLLQRKINNKQEMSDAAKDLLKLGPHAVLLKGGHFGGPESPDCLMLANERLYWYDAHRIDSDNTHGTGCTLSSAVAAYLARGHSLVESVPRAKKYINSAIIAGSDYKIGKGHGPVHHFYKLWAE